MAHLLETTNRYEPFNPTPANDTAHLPATLESVSTVATSLETPVFKGWSCVEERRAERPLSPRERQILSLIIDGKTRKEVAYDLEIAHSTVRVIYSRAMKKLGGRWQPMGGRKI
jgi:DNA-binding NarL/FixJ family response regulator